MANKKFNKYNKEFDDIMKEIESLDKKSQRKILSDMGILVLGLSIGLELVLVGVLSRKFG